MAASPMGPHPNTATPSPACTSAWSAARIPTASGSANAATSRARSSGRRWRRPRSASVTSRSGVRPPSGAPLPIRPSSSSPGWTTTRSPRWVVVTSAPDPVHRAGHLVAEAHGGAGRAGHAAHLDVGEVAAADPAGGHPNHDIAGPGVGLVDVVDPDVVGPVDAYLPHRCARSALFEAEQVGAHGLAQGGVDDLDADTEVVAVVGETHRGVVTGPAAELQRAPHAGQPAAVGR